MQQILMTKSQKLRCSALFAGLISRRSSQDNGSRVCSYTPADTHEAFANTMARMSAAKPEIMRRQKTLLEQRYDLGNHAAQSFFNMIQQFKLAPQVKADLVAFLRAL